MSERPNVLLGLLLAVALLFASLLAVGISSLGSHGAASLAATLVGAVSACIFSLVELRHVPITLLVLVALAAASLLSFTRTIRDYLRQRRLLRALPLEPLEDARLRSLLGGRGVDVYVTPASRPAAFCFGLLRPRVVVTTGLISQLDPEEQVAAVCHEAHHVRAREPLKCLLARLAAATFFWLPVLADLLDRYLLVKELAADRLAVRHTSTRALAGALHEVAGSSTPAAAVGLAEFAAARIDRLFDSGASLPPVVRRSRLAVSAIAAILLGLMAAVPARVDVSAPHNFGLAFFDGQPHGLSGICAGVVSNGALLIAVAVISHRLFVRRQRARRTPLG